MKLVGFNFTKINIEKLLDRVDNLKINSNIDIPEIKEVDVGGLFKAKEKIIAIKFINTINYEPGLAKIDLQGNLLLSIEPKIAKQVLNEWKDKKMPEDFRLTLFNLILRKCGVRALQLEEEMNLPHHINFPVLRRQPTNTTNSTDTTNKREQQG